MIPLIPGFEVAPVSELGCNRGARRMLRFRRRSIGERVNRREPIGEMAVAEGEMIRLESAPIGEMAADLESLVPAGKGIDVAAIKEGDSDPLEVVVSVDAGKSRRGIHYTEKALGEIASMVNEKGGLPGYLGHQKAEDINNQFVPPVTHWIGAKQQGKTFYFRGVIDQAATDLKRWIRTKRITQTSIFGMPKLARSFGEIKAVGYEPISIDWTPLHRAGMPSAIVALGEMDQILKPGETAEDETKGKGGRMELAEWLAEGRAIKAAPQVVIGEMGWNTDQVLEALKDVEIRDEHDKAAVKAIGEMCDALGVEGDTPDAKLGNFTKRINELLETDRKAREDAHGETISKVVGEMVAQEDAREFVSDLVKPKLEKDADEAAIKKVVGEMLESEQVKRALKGFGISTMTVDPQGGANGGGNTSGKTRSVPQGARTRRARI